MQPKQWLSPRHAPPIPSSKNHSAVSQLMPEEFGELPAFDAMLKQDLPRVLCTKESSVSQKMLNFAKCHDNNLNAAGTHIGPFSPVANAECITCREKGQQWIQCNPKYLVEGCKPFDTSVVRATDRNY